MLLEQIELRIQSFDAVVRSAILFPFVLCENAIDKGFFVKQLQVFNFFT